MQPAVTDKTFFTNTHKRLSGHIIRFITVLYCLSNYYYSVLFSPFSIFFTVFFFNFCLSIFSCYSFAIFYPWKNFLVTRFLVTALLVTRYCVSRFSNTLPRTLNHCVNQAIVIVGTDLIFHHSRIWTKNETEQVSLSYRHSRSFKFRFINLCEVAMVTF